MSDGKFSVQSSFIFGGIVRREDAVLTIGEGDLAAEVALGVHPKTGKPMSGILNHCSPENEAADAAIAELKEQGAKIPPQPVYPDTDEETRIDEIRAEIEGMGAAYDKRWGLKRLEMELTKAKKARGL